MEVKLALSDQSDIQNKIQCMNSETQNLSSDNDIVRESFYQG